MVVGEALLRSIPLRKKTNHPQMVCHKIQKLCTAKEAAKQVKVEPAGWEGGFTSYPSAVGLVSRLYKELTK